jgi:hypothetical protein
VTLPRVVTDESILVFWKAALFAGRRRNEGLGRSVGCLGFLPGQARADDSGCSKSAEEGNVVSMRHKAYALDAGTKNRACVRGRVLRSVLRPVHVDPHSAPQGQTSEVGRSIRHHGWANSRKREEPALGSGRTDVARLATRHSFAQAEGRDVTKKRKEIEVSVPARIRRARVWLPARRKCSCRSHQAASGLE